MTYRRSILSAAIVTCLGVAVQAHAQDAQPTGTQATDLDTVVVTGIRGSVEKSLDVKREAKSHVEVITAEDIGKMPDKNVADSLQRIPGVTVSSAGANEGGFDENDRVSMRGTNPSLTQTLFNGHNIASGDWFVLNQTGTVGRSVSYTLLPSELVSQIVVHKSSQASLVEGGVAGSVDIITRKPLEFAENFTAEASIGAVYSDLPSETEPQFSGLLNWKNDAGTLGVLVQAFSEERSLRRDGQELLGYEQIAPGSAVALSNPDLAGVWYPTMIGSALFEQKRERKGGLLEVQIKPTDDLTLGVNAFVSDQKAGNYNRNYLLWVTHFLARGTGQAPLPGYVVRNGTLVQADFAGVPGTTYGVYDQISRPDASADSSFIAFDAKWQPSDSLVLKAQLGTSDGTGETPTQDVAEWNVGIGAGGGWGLNGVGAADWYIGGNPASNAADTLGWIFGYQDVKVEDEEKWGQIDGEYFIDKGAMSSLQFGVRYAEHSRESLGATGQGPACKDASGNTVAFDWGQPYFCPVGTQSPFDPANYPTGGYANYPGDFADGLGGTFPRDIWYYSPQQLAAFNDRFTNRNPTTRTDWAGLYGIHEESSAAYVQLNLEGDRWSGNVGLRYVRTEERIHNNVSGTGSPDAITGSDFGPYLPGHHPPYVYRLAAQRQLQIRYHRGPGGPRRGFAHDDPPGLLGPRGRRFAQPAAVRRRTGLGQRRQPRPEADPVHQLRRVGGVVLRTSRVAGRQRVLHGPEGLRVLRPGDAPVHDLQHDQPAGLPGGLRADGAGQQRRQGQGRGADVRTTDRRQLRHQRQLHVCRRRTG